MSTTISRSIDEPIRENRTWQERWQGPDQGLITAWEAGRQLAVAEPERAERAKRGELPFSAWKGGVERATKKKAKSGTLWYLAEWQGLRGDDLNIDPTAEHSLKCALTGITIVYTNDPARYGNQ